MAKSSGFIGQYTKEQNDKIKVLVDKFDMENPDIASGMTADGKEKHTQAKLDLIKKEMGIKVSKIDASGYPKLDTTEGEALLKESSKIFKNISLDPRKLFSGGMDYVNSLKDVSDETHENNWKDIRAKEKLINLEKFIKKAGVAEQISALEHQKAINDAAGDASPRQEEELKFLYERKAIMEKMFTDREKDAKSRKAEAFTSRRERIMKATGIRDWDFEKQEYIPLEGDKEEEEKINETLMKRRKIFKRIWQKPMLKIKESVERNGGVFGAIGEFLEEGFTKLVEFTSKMLGYLKKAFIYLGLMLLALFVLYRVFKNAGVREALAKIWEDTKVFYQNYLLPPLLMVWDGLSQIIQGFREGKFYLVLVGLLKIFGGLIIFSLQLMSLAFQIGLRLLWESLIGIGKWLFASGQGWKKTASKILYIAAAIAFIVAFFAGGWIPILVGAIMMGIAMLLEGLKFWSSGGTTTTSGLSVVGEKGPELVKLPIGSTVYSNPDSQKMLTSGGGTTNNITIQVSGRVGASDSEIKDIANKLSRELNNRMNRTGSAVSGF